MIALVVWVEARAGVRGPFPQTLVNRGPQRKAHEHTFRTCCRTYAYRFLHWQHFRVTYSTGVLARYVRRQDDYAGRPKSGRAILFNLIYIYGTA